MSSSGVATAIKLLDELKPNKVLVVCSKRAKDNDIVQHLLQHVNKSFFHDFSPNPKYPEILKGIHQFKAENCDFILSIGGGSAIDTAKCIKAWLHAECPAGSTLFSQAIKDSGVPHLAIPTTAGTGSEETHFAAIYHEGRKYSVTSPVIKPDYAALIPEFLSTLPLYQKASTLLDALCQAIESYWCINSTAESKQYSRKCIQLILKNFTDYFANQPSSFAEIMQASNYSGRAINITQTTAPHAMSYQLTLRYGYAHGHAVAICLPPVWDYMASHLDDCVDPRGSAYLKKTFKEILDIFAVPDVSGANEKLHHICTIGKLKMTHTIAEKDLDLLTRSVNAERLKNNPVRLDQPAIRSLYRKLI